MESLNTNTKMNKKIIVGLLFVILLVVFILLAKTFNGMSMCLERYGSFTSDIKIESTEQTCAFGKQNIDNIEGCYTDVQKKYLISYKLVESFVKAKGAGAVISKMKMLHNSKCSSVPKTLFEL